MFDKITSRISKLCYGLNDDFIVPVSLCVVPVSRDGYGYGQRRIEPPEAARRACNLRN